MCYGSGYGPDFDTDPADPGQIDTDPETGKTNEVPGVSKKSHNKRSYLMHQVMYCIKIHELKLSTNNHANVFKKGNLCS